jgi:transcriptional regulator with XRE-family HTH domain
MERNARIIEDCTAFSANEGCSERAEWQIGDRIMQLRKRQGWSRAELAKRLGVSCERLKKWEQGVNLPGLEMLVPLSRTLGVSLEELVTGQPAPRAGLSPERRNEAMSHAAALVRLLRLPAEVEDRRPGSRSRRPFE